MIDLKKTPCKIGNVNVRNELHGEEKVPAMDITLENILLGKAEVASLFGDKTWWDRNFNEKGKLAEPADKIQKPRGLDLKFENASVHIYVGLKLELIELDECVLTKLVIDPQVGGLTALKLTVQATPEIDEVAAPLINWMGRDASVEIDFGDVAKESEKEKQGDLALNSHGNGEAPDGKPKPRARRKPSEGATVN